MKEAIEDTVRRFIARDLSPAVQVLDEYQPDDRKKGNILSEMDKIGIVQMPLPESSGGIGFDPPFLGRVLEILAECCAGTSMVLWSHYSGLIPFLLSAGGMEVIRKLPEEGKAVLGTGYVSQNTLSAKKDGTTYTVSGSISFLWGIPGATSFAIAAQTPQEGIIALVPSDTRGVTIHEVHKRIGLRCCMSSSVEMADVPISTHVVSLPIPEFENILYQSKAYSMGLLGSIAVGNARGSVRRAFKYAGERYQGGDIIINLPLIQGMLGEMAAVVQSAGACVEQAFSAPQHRRQIDLSLAKAYATKSGEKVCLDSMQVFGGYGYMREYGAEKHLRDSKMLCTVGESNRKIFQRAVSDMKEMEGII